VRNGELARKGDRSAGKGDLGPPPRTRTSLGLVLTACKTASSIPNIASQRALLPHCPNDHVMTCVMTCGVLSRLGSAGDSLEKQGCPVCGPRAMCMYFLVIEDGRGLHSPVRASHLATIPDTWWIHLLPSSRPRFVSSPQSSCQQ
jgi:hypothetical protein